MATSNRLLWILVWILLAACKKTESAKEQRPAAIFNFVYNGKVYNISEISPSVLDAGVTRNRFNAPALQISMPSIFGGDIYFEEGNCAYLEPTFTSLRVNGDCIITSQNSYGQDVPIDSTTVYLYQSGSMDVKFSNISTRTVTEKDWFLGTTVTITYTTCSAAGTFELTLVNKENETIKITDGVVNIRDIQFQD